MNFFFLTLVPEVGDIFAFELGSFKVLINLFAMISSSEILNLQSTINSVSFVNFPYSILNVNEV